MYIKQFTFASAASLASRDRVTCLMAQMSADVSVVESTLLSVTSGNLRRKAEAVATGSASPEHMTCDSGIASQSSVHI